nr:helix-turn-helix domain-containing protein [uncultured Sphaerochaeta sp.]
MGAHVTRRVGLVLASIHTGASNGLWSQIASHCQRSGISLFVFPGGRLEYQENQEYLRNAIYSLVNTDNLDGVITWASALGGAVSVPEVHAFLDNLDGLDCVCIGMKKEGCPGISFDAYSGVQSVMLHCIREHRARKIAFLRGPENHYSAEDRYRAYCDTLDQTSLLFDPRLVSDPFSWSEGRKAIVQLLEERKLVPGRDFDTLVCASDLMMFDAGKYLENLGFSIPEDLRIVGYNDSRESHLLKVPCTTARMPVNELARMSWNLLSDMLSEEDPSCFDLLLPSQPIIRQSCGCTYSLGSEQQARRVIGSQELFKAWLIQVFDANEEEQERIGLLLKEASLQHEKEVLSLLGHLSYRFLDRGGDPSLLSEALHWYCTFFATLSFKTLCAGPIRDLFLRQRDLVAHEHAYQHALQASILNMLKCDLLGVKTLSTIPSLLAKHLGSLGLDAGYLVLYGDETTNSFIGGYADSLVMERRQSFPKHLLLPQGLLDHLGQGVHVVEPLFMDNQPLGYLILRTSLFSGSVMEELRTALSSAIKGAFLLDAANRAREDAERAQRSRSEFFANVGEGLKTPLETILSIAKQVEGEMGKQIEEQIRSATHLLDLSLSHSGNLELENKVCNPMTLITPLLTSFPLAYEGSEEMPSLCVDAKRLIQSLTIICEYIVREGGEMRLQSSLSKDGLRFRFASSSVSWKASMGSQEPSLSLAQRIILMSHGSFSLHDNAVVVQLPLPSLMGESSPPARDTLFYIVADGDEPIPEVLLASFASCEVIPVGTLQKHELSKIAGGVIGWDADNQGREFRLLRTAIAGHNTLSLAPMVCLHAPEGQQNLYSSLMRTSHHLSDGVLVAIKGLPEDCCKALALDEEFIVHSEPDEVLDVVANQPVKMILSSLFDPALYRNIRKSSDAPIVVIREHWEKEEAEQLSLVPRLLIAHQCVLESSEFGQRLLELLETNEMLPPLTGALVKRAVVYLGRHATQQISRWQLAESVNVSEDYLTRIFRKELGISPWDYLNRQRVFLATQLLRESSLSINEVASQSGFQDQAYFCRVFKKIKGCAPGKIRSQH